jgi:hypothetical protein
MLSLTKLYCSKFVYACWAFSGFLCASDLSRFQASFNKTSLIAVKYDIKNLLEERDTHLFMQILLHPDHCFNDLFPSERENHGRLLRTRDHQYTLPIVKSFYHKSSFVIIDVCLILSEVSPSFCCLVWSCRCYECCSLFMV